MTDRARVEALLPAEMVRVIHTTCAGLGLPVARWPGVFRDFVYVAVAARVAELCPRELRTWTAAVDRACAELEESPGAFKAWWYDRRAP